MVDTLINEGVDGIIALGTVSTLVQCITLCAIAERSSEATHHYVYRSLVKSAGELKKLIMTQ